MLHQTASYTPSRHKYGPQTLGTGAPESQNRRNRANTHRVALTSLLHRGMEQAVRFRRARAIARLVPAQRIFWQFTTYDWRHGLEKERDVPQAHFLVVSHAQLVAFVQRRSLASKVTELQGCR